MSGLSPVHFVGNKKGGNMKRLYLFFALAACLPTALFAQQTESKKRSAWHLTIPEVTVIGHRPMKEIGVQKTKFDSLALKENIALSMADILTFNSSVFVKSYGRATLSTVAFRGTSPSHTQVTWNGMRINNPMLGMTDFSTIPSYFIDQASLLHGRRWTGRSGQAWHDFRSRRGFQCPVRAGHRLVQDFRRVRPLHLWQ